MTTEATDYAPIAAALTPLAGALPDAVRLFHGRGQRFPGLEHLCIDWYPPIILITAYQEPARPGELVDLITQADVDKQVGTIIRQARYQQGAPATLLHGEPRDTTVVSENGLRFEVRPGQQQNAGLFLDMRLLRGWLREHSAGHNLLNLFAYTCSLSVAALAGGARQVVNVDMSKPSIRWGDENHRLNGQDPRSVKSIPHNLFRSWGRIKQFGRYDTVVIDPPTRQRGSFDVEKNYPAVIKKLHQLTQPRATVIATVNSPYLSSDFLQNQFARHAPEMRFIETMPAAPEFADKFPERALNILRFVRND